MKYIQIDNASIIQVPTPSKFREILFTHLEDFERIEFEQLTSILELANGKLLCNSWEYVYKMIHYSVAKDCCLPPMALISTPSLLLHPSVITLIQVNLTLDPHFKFVSDLDRVFDGWDRGNDYEYIFSGDTTKSIKIQIFNVNILSDKTAIDTLWPLLIP